MHVTKSGKLLDIMCSLGYGGNEVNLFVDNIFVNLSSIDQFSGHGQKRYKKI